jgi:hypothetical protein
MLHLCYRCALSFLLAGSALCLTAAPAAAQERSEKPRYYMCVFAQETNPRAARSAHTFATFVKSDGRGFEAHTISWLPRTDDVRLLRAPEPGMNLDLKATLDRAAAMKAQLFEWGPFEVKAELYERALKQIDRLRSGTVLYKAIDLKQRPASATNCFDAVADIDTDRGLLAVAPAFGREASERVVEHLERWIIDPGKTYPTVNEKLGLGKGITMQTKASPR